MTQKQVSPPRRRIYAVFDSSAIFTNDPTRILCNDVHSAIQESGNHPYLSINWYLPKMVLLENKKKSQERLGKLIDGIKEVNRILRRDIGVTLDILIQSTEEAIDNEIHQFGVNIFDPDYHIINWNKLIEDSSSRNPPFSPGPSEKGFRDAIIIESYFQILSSIPQNGDLNYAILITSDELMVKAVNNRAIEDPRFHVPADLENLRTIVATFISELDIELVNRLLPKASILFFSPGELNTFYYSESIKNRLESEYASCFQVLPPSADYRRNYGPSISPCRFVRKENSRYYWANRIEYATMAFRKSSSLTIEDIYKINSQIIDYPHLSSEDPTTYISGTSKAFWVPEINSITDYNFINIPHNIQSSSSPILISIGTTGFEVVWSSIVNEQENILQSRIENISYITSDWS